MVEYPIADRIGLRFREAIVDCSDQFVTCIGNGVDLTFRWSVHVVADGVIVPRHVRVVVISS